MIDYGVWRTVSARLYAELLSNGAADQQLFAAQLAASQAAQNETLKAYMSGQLAYYNPRPVPAFPVPAPYQYGNCGTCNGCGC